MLSRFYSNRLFDLSRKKKRLILIGFDAFAMVFAFWGAVSLRLGEWWTPDSLNVVAAFAITAVFTVLVFVRSGLYRAVLRFIGTKAFKTVFYGVVLSALVLSASTFLLKATVPRSVPLIYFAILLMLVGGVRYVFRAQYLIHSRKQKTNVVIFGAGATGIQLCNAIENGNEYHPVAFIDDDPAKHRIVLNNAMVHRRESLQTLIDDFDVREVFIAVPKATKAELKNVLEYLEPYSVHVKTVPAFDELGQPDANNLRDIEVEDLLGRDPVEPNKQLLEKCIKGKNVLVTGAGGSIGSELSRQILALGATRLVLFEVSEFNLYKIEQELNSLKYKHGYGTKLVPCLGNIQNKSRLKSAMTENGIQTVYHAAAYKHVPLVEDNVVEGVRNNVFGTIGLVEAAEQAGVEDFVLISTDKAVRPTNVMGATKRLAELVLQAKAKVIKSTNFSMVRFGNVLGSSGSVVPLFRQQISAGGPVTVTHPEITRYFMTIPEAASLVIQAGAMAKGGDVFVLDMGEPVKIADLAKRMIHLMGCKEKSIETPDGIEVAFSGLRPGEKLYEELLVGGNVSGTKHPRIMSANEVEMADEDLRLLINALDESCSNMNAAGVVDLLKKAPLAFERHSQGVKVGKKENVLQFKI